MDIAYQEFLKQEQQYSSGYLVLIDNQVLYFPTKKDWESTKDTYPQHQQRFLAVDLEKWKNRFTKDLE